MNDLWMCPLLLYEDNVLCGRPIPRHGCLMVPHARANCGSKPWLASPCRGGTEVGFTVEKKVMSLLCSLPTALLTTWRSYHSYSLDCE
jgi:hypothetical protein